MLWDSTCFSTFIHLSTIWQEADDDETGTIDESEQHWHRHCSLMFIWFFWSLGVNCNNNPICRPLYLSSGDGWRMFFCSCFLMSVASTCFYKQVFAVQARFCQVQDILWTAKGSHPKVQPWPNQQRPANISFPQSEPLTRATRATCATRIQNSFKTSSISTLGCGEMFWLHWNDPRCIHSWKSMVSLCHGPKTKMLDLEGNKTTESLQATANWFCNLLVVFEFAISSKMIWSERKRSNLNMLFKSMDADGQGSEFFEVLRVVHALIGFVARNAHFWWTLWWCSWQNSECRVARCCRKSSTDCVFFCFETAYWRSKGPPYVWNLKIISTYFDYIILDFAG